MASDQKSSVPQPNAYPLVLVTGGAGWIGRRVVEALTTGGVDTGLPKTFSSNRLRCLIPESVPAASLDDFGVEIVRGDIIDPYATRRFCKDAEGALVIHMAGIIHPPATDTSVWRKVNVDGTRQLAMAAQSAGVRRLCVMSSNSPMGTNRSATDLFAENSPYNPYMGYGKSKHLMELFLRNKIMGHGAMETVIIRAPWFYGPGQPPRQTRFFRMIRDGKFPIFAGGNNLRSMAYVDNLAQGILRASFLPQAANEIFWIADEAPYPMRQIVETVADVLRTDFKYSDVPDWRNFPGFIPDVARVVDASAQSIGLYHQSIHVLSEMNLHIACSVEKAKNLLGYEPRVALREGMRRSIEWCLENGMEI